MSFDEDAKGWMAAQRVNDNEGEDEDEDEKEHGA